MSSSRPSIIKHRDVQFQVREVEQHGQPRVELLEDGGVVHALKLTCSCGEVTVVELLPQILPAEDAEIAAFARKAFERQGIQIHTEASVRELEREGEGLRAHVQLADGGTKTLDVARAIVAVGVTGNVEDVGLETTRVRVEAGAIVIDEWCRTDEPGIYAIGDVAGGPQLAHRS